MFSISREEVDLFLHAALGNVQKVNRIGWKALQSNEHLFCDLRFRLLVRSENKTSLKDMIANNEIKHEETSRYWFSTRIMPQLDYPPYLSDLVSCEFYIYPEMKLHIQSVENVKSKKRRIAFFTPVPNLITLGIVIYVYQQFIISYR